MWLRPAPACAALPSPARRARSPAQVESDIAPYKGLLMGLFFMTGAWGRSSNRAPRCWRGPTRGHVPPALCTVGFARVLAGACCARAWCGPTCRQAWSRQRALPCRRAVGMEISVPLFFAKIKAIVAAMTMLIVGKVAVMAAVGQAFGLTLVQSARRWARSCAGRRMPCRFEGTPVRCVLGLPARPLRRPLLCHGCRRCRRRPWPPRLQRPAAVSRRRVCVCAVWRGGEPRHHGRRAGQGALPGGGP